MSVTELVGGAIGCTLLGLGRHVAGRVEPSSPPTDRSLLYFGLWCCLYGIRLVAEQPFVRATLGGSGSGWRYFLAFVTYVINVPSGLFIEAWSGRDGGNRFAGSGRRRLVLRDRGDRHGPAARPSTGGDVPEFADRARRTGDPASEPLVPPRSAGPLVQDTCHRDRRRSVLALFVINENLGRPVDAERQPGADRRVGLHDVAGLWRGRQRHPERGGAGGGAARAPDGTPDSSVAPAARAAAGRRPRSRRALYPDDRGGRRSVRHRVARAVADWHSRRRRRRATACRRRWSRRWSSWPSRPRPTRPTIRRAS